MPMAPGVPQFTLRRSGQTLVDVAGNKAIIAEETPENSPLNNAIC